MADVDGWSRWVTSMGGHGWSRVVTGGHGWRCDGRSDGVVVIVRDSQNMGR